MKTDDSSDASSREQRRFQFMEQFLAGLGKSWAASMLQEMSTDRRSIEGGWPGRLAEARALTVRELTRQLSTRGMGPPSADELASAPATVNDHARKEWLQAIKAERLARRVSSPGDK